MLSIKFIFSFRKILSNNFASMLYKIRKIKLCSALQVILRFYQKFILESNIPVKESSIFCIIDIWVKCCPLPIPRGPARVSF